VIPRHLHLSIGLVVAIIFFAACQAQPTNKSIFIEVDGARQSMTTDAITVREALGEAEIELEKLDRVKPDLYTQLEPGLTIVVTRVTEKLEIEREVVPFERQTVVNEALAAGETRIAQLGANGEDEITIRVVYENGEEASRTEMSRIPAIAPVPEIMVIGPRDTLAPVQVNGTIAYISNGNAWLMRSNNSSRRALTTHGKLDSQVFSLSPDSRRLLYTTRLTDEIELPLNEVWLASTTIVGEEPITTGIRGVLHAHWSPVISRPVIAFSTAKRTATPPGWQANNDLWLYTPPAPGSDSDTPPEPVEIIGRNTQGLYPWWGNSFAWSPDGTQLAYARADQIGIITLITNSTTLSSSITPLVDFVPLETFSDWVWVPNLSWSPDGKFIAATVHGPPLAGEPPEESQLFNLWLFSADGTISANVAGQVGMWANPSWGKAGVAFGSAINPLQSVTSRYAIELVDWDGSNKRQIFPFRDEPGVQFPELVWSPGGEDLLFVYNGNLHITGRSGGVPKQLTTDGQASRPQWGLASTLTLTSTFGITSGHLITSSLQITGTPKGPVTITATRRRPTATPSPSATGTAAKQASTPTPTITRPKPSATPTATRTRPNTATATVRPTRTSTPAKRATTTPTNTPSTG